MNKAVEDAKVGELSKDVRGLIKGAQHTITELETILKSKEAKQTLANVTAHNLRPEDHSQPDGPTVVEQGAQPKTDYGEY